MIEKRTESARGCGWRKAGGLYLVCGGVPSCCGKLPLEMTICPTCGTGIKPSRSWTWVDGDALFSKRKCSAEGPLCRGCLLEGEIGRAGLIWCGEKFYKTPTAFLKESEKLGVSRRITAVPKGFEVGKTTVLMAHRNGIGEIVTSEDGLRKEKFVPAIFAVFRPSAIEYIVKGDETKEQMESLEKRGITAIKVVRDIDANDLGVPEGQSKE